MDYYKTQPDKRDTSSGMTPNKAIKRGPPPKVVRRPQGK